MNYISEYSSPLGKMIISADEDCLNGLWFEGQKHFPDLSEHKFSDDSKIIRQTQSWLDEYFAGNNPEKEIPVSLIGTPFQTDVWKILRTIPYGQTITYGKIAKLLAEKYGRSHMSAQAVGGAVGRNRISIIIPCHRVIGTDGSLTGYAGGLDRKTALLRIEGLL